MKKILLLAGLALSLCTAFKSEAQVRVNIQIGAPVAQQSWYGDDEDYYYMPEHGVYYNVRRRCYVYPEGGRWMYANNLPSRYGGYTWNSGRYYRVHERAPFRRHDYYRNQYSVAYNGGYRGGNQRDYGRHDNGAHNGWDRNENGHDSRDDRGYNNGSNGGNRNNTSNGGNQYGGSNHYNRR